MAYLADLWYPAKSIFLLRGFAETQIGRIVGDLPDRERLRLLMCMECGPTDLLSDESLVC